MGKCKVIDLSPFFFSNTVILGSKCPSDFSGVHKILIDRASIFMNFKMISDIHLIFLL